MNIRLLLLICIALGIIWFVLSVAFRRKQRLRKIFLNLGILTGLLPLLIYFAFSLFQFIKERPFVGNYEGDTGVQGIASLDIFDDNTFILRSDSCSTGFVQGTWSYNWMDKSLDFESTSQRMGETRVTTKDSIVFKNVPICIKLVREMHVGKTGKPMVVPMEELEY